MTVKFIADVGGNHNQDLNRMSELVDAAAVCGCAAVKVQLYRADRLYSPAFASTATAARQTELPPAWLPGIASLCRRAGLEFHVTPFDLQSLELARPYADALKIASYSILDLPLIEAAAACGKPVTISTGLATMDEINNAYTTARMKNFRVDLYHCAAVYPAAAAICDLEMIDVLKRKFGACGWSDHTRLPGVIYYAVALGARAVEFHLDLNDGLGHESQHGHCWTPEEIYPVITGVDKSQAALKQLLGANFTEVRKWRADPEDEMRPLMKYRDELLGKR